MNNNERDILRMVGEIAQGLDKEMEASFGKEVVDVIKQHAVAGAACGLIPFPGVDILAVVGNVWTMYARINKALGIHFGEAVLKSIATGIATNIISMIPGLLLAKAGGFLAKMIPGFGTLGGIAIDTGVNFAIVYVMGAIYIKSILLLTEKKVAFTEEALKEATKIAMRDKEFVRNTFNSAKKQKEEEDKRDD